MIQILQVECLLLRLSLILKINIWHTYCMLIVFLFFTKSSFASIFFQSKTSTSSLSKWLDVHILCIQIYGYHATFAGSQTLQQQAKEQKLRTQQHSTLFDRNPVFLRPLNIEKHWPKINTCISGSLYSLAKTYLSRQHTLVSCTAFRFYFESCNSRLTQQWTRNCFSTTPFNCKLLTGNCLMTFFLGFPM